VLWSKIRAHDWCRFGVCVGTEAAYRHRNVGGRGAKARDASDCVQWDIVHKRTESETIEHTFKVLVEGPFQLRATSASPPPSPRLSASPARSPVPKSPGKATASPTLATLKELLHTPMPESDQFEFHMLPKSSKQAKSPKPKSPRHSLRSLWSMLDKQPQANIPSILKRLVGAKNRR
jgi:hypothetical protein